MIEVIDLGPTERGDRKFRIQNATHFYPVTITREAYEHKMDKRLLEEAKRQAEDSFDKITQ